MVQHLARSMRRWNRFLPPGADGPGGGGFSFLNYPDIAARWGLDADDCALTAAAADFDGVDDVLTTTDNASLDHGGDDITVIGWAKRDAVAAEQTLVAKWAASAATQEYRLHFQADNDLGLSVSDGSTATTATVAGASSTSRWYFCAGRLDSSVDPEQKVWLGDDLGTVLATGTLGTFTGSVPETAEPLELASDNASTFLNGQMQNWVLYHRSLTDAQITWLYNAGAGRTLNDVITSTDADNPGTTGLVSWWALNEATGVRMDLWGSNHLTQTGGVGQAAGHVEQAAKVASTGAEFEQANSDVLTGVTIPTGLTGYDATFACWFRSTSATDQTIMGVYGAGTRLFRLFLNSGGAGRANLNDGVTSEVAQTIAATYADGEWHLLVGAINSTHVKVWVDDQAPVLNAHVLSFPAFTTFTIGDTNGTQFFDGDLAMAGVWPTEWTDQQVLDYWNDGAGLVEGHADIPSGAIGFWPLNANDLAGEVTARDGFTTVNYLHKSEADYRASDNSGAIEFWFRSTGETSDRYPFSYWIDSISEQLSVYIHLTGRVGLKFNDSANADNLRTATTGFDDDSWHHVIITSNGSTWNVYIDLSDEALTVATGSNSGGWFGDLGSGVSDLTVGNRAPFSTPIFNTIIGQVRVYDSVPTSGDRNELFNLGRGIVGEFTDTTLTSGLKPVNNWQLGLNPTTDLGTEPVTLTEVGTTTAAEGIPAGIAGIGKDTVGDLGLFNDGVVAVDGIPAGQSDAGPVFKLVDKAGNNDATQPTFSDQARLKNLVAGRFLEFTSDNYDVADAAGLDGGTGFTAIAVVQFASTGLQYVFYKQGTPAVYHLSQTGGNLSFHLDGVVDGLTVSTTGAPTVIGVPYIVMLRYDGALQQIYIDGTLAVSTAHVGGDVENSAGPLEIGSSLGGSNFDGLLYHLNIWDVAATDDQFNEIGTHFAAEIGKSWNTIS